MPFYRRKDTWFGHDVKAARRGTVKTIPPKRSPQINSYWKSKVDVRKLCKKKVKVKGGEYATEKTAFLMGREKGGRQIRVRRA